MPSDVYKRQIVYGSELPEDLAANMTALLAAAEASHV